MKQGVKAVKWWHDDANFRRWEAWNKARKTMAYVPTLHDWLFTMALLTMPKESPARDPESPPWVRSSSPGVLSLTRELEGAP